MNFDDAIAAHIKWKVRLRRFIDGMGDGDLNSAIVGRDDLCDLGKWLHGEGAKFKEAPHYQDLLQKHANFHVCAAAIVKKVEDGDLAGAGQALNAAIVTASKETVSAIMEVKKEAAKL